MHPSVSVPMQAAPRQLAGMFIDFENIYYELKNQAPDIEVTDPILSVIRNIRTHFEQEINAVPIIAKAYADYERLDASPQGSLYLMGVETTNVFSTEHKNSADMRLCIDVLEVLYTRPEISTYILVAGDRDYIPVVQHLRRQGKHVFLSSFKSNLSGDLLQNVERGKFLDSFKFLSEEELRVIELSKVRAQVKADALSGTSSVGPYKIAITPVVNYARKQAQESQGGLPSGEQSQPALAELIAVSAGGTLEKLEAASTAPLPTTEKKIFHTFTRPAAQPVENEIENEFEDDESFGPTQPVSDQMTRRCLGLMLDHFGRHQEVWMSPLLWKLSNTMPTLADFERKVLIANLQTAGAIRIVKRHGETHDYSACIINYNHPSVRECMP